MSKDKEHEYKIYLSFTRVLKGEKLYDIDPRNLKDKEIETEYDDREIKFPMTRVDKMDEILAVCDNLHGKNNKGKESDVIL
jgi:hypothetical protein